MPAHTALSLKQPWATLLIHGLKTIEVRTWPTRLRGPLLIHAARIPDRRPDAWSHVPDELKEAAQTLRGGVVGVGELVGCKAYRTTAEFQRDQALHLNEPSWFRPPALFGFQIANLRALPFHPCPGQTSLFRLDLPVDKAARWSRLLVSVRTAAEAEAALAGGADLIDIKEPSRGSLGRAEDGTLAAIAAVVKGRKPLSAALGEQLELAGGELPANLSELAFVKWGLAGCNKAGTDWRLEWRRLAARVKATSPSCEPVLVAYADWERAGAPSYVEVSLFALERAGGVLLLDTWHKDGSHLFEHLSAGEVEKMMRLCRSGQVQVALAGSLRREHLDLVRQLHPSWLAVRGAACGGGRLGAVEEGKVRALVEGLASPTSVPAARRGRRSRRGS